MTEVFVLGFPRSTYVHIVRLMLTHKGVSYTFRDLEPEMGSASHLALHPFDRVPILQHGDFTLYETSAIATYVDEAFEGPALQPKDVRARARMNQWISSVNSYYYPYMIHHVTHERLVYPQLGIASDEKVVAHALPKVQRALDLLEKALGHGGEAGEYGNRGREYGCEQDSAHESLLELATRCARVRPRPGCYAAGIKSP